MVRSPVNQPPVPVAGAGAGPGPLPLEVVEVDAAQHVRPRGHVDHTPLGAPLQAVQKQVGPQQLRKVVERKRALKPIGRHLPRVPVTAHVVDQHIDPRTGLQHFRGHPSHLRQG
jgi:hypothetical protein